MQKPPGISRFKQLLTQELFRPVGRRKKGDLEHCSGCNEKVDSRDMMPAPGKESSQKWCIDCVNRYQDDLEMQKGVDLDTPRTS